MEDRRHLEALLKALANERRLDILAALRQHRTLTVSEIAAVINLKMKATSQHLKILRSVGIVRTTKDSLYVSCRLNLNQEDPTKTVLRML